MKIILRKPISLLLFLCMVFQLALINAVALEPELRQIQIISHDSTIDLSDIEVMVFEAELAYTSESGDHEIFEETYSHSVLTNSRGVASFEPPSEYFSISVNLSTLPHGTGISGHTFFFLPWSVPEVYEISLIESAELSQQQGSFSPHFFNAEGEKIYAEYELEVFEAGRTRNRGLYDSKRIEVEAYGKTYEFFGEVIRYEVAEESMGPTTIPVHENPRHFELFRYRVHYDANSMSAQSAAAVARELVDLHDFFIDDHSFRHPIGVHGSIVTDRYDVYLQHNLTSGGNPANGVATAIGTTGQSRIIIDYSVASNTSIDTNRRHVIAHEFFHTIMHRYGIFSANGNDQRWMHEAFASWAEIAYTGESHGMNTMDINRFLSTSTTTPLNDISESARVHGSLLFPLYIQQQTGGIRTIRRILESYPGGISPVFDAIENGLPPGHRLGSTLAGFYAFNYSPAHFYMSPPEKTDWIMPSENIRITGTPFFNRASTVQPLSARYERYVPPNTTPRTLTATIEFSPQSDPQLHTITTRPGNIRQIRSHAIFRQPVAGSSPRASVIQHGFRTGGTASNAASALTLIPVNASRLNSMTYTISATTQTPVFGDAFADGRVDAADVTASRRFLAAADRHAWLSEQPSFSLANADADGSNSVNSEDVTLLRTYLSFDPSNRPPILGPRPIIPAQTSNGGINISLRPDANFPDTLTPGDTFTLEIYLGNPNNVSIASLTDLVINLPPALEWNLPNPSQPYVPFTNSPLRGGAGTIAASMGGFQFQPNFPDAITENSAMLNFDSRIDFTGSGILARFDLKVKDDFIGGNALIEMNARSAAGFLGYWEQPLLEGRDFGLNNKTLSIAGEVFLGDADRDGTLTANDITTLRRFIASPQNIRDTYENINPNFNRRNADMNQDGYVTSTDVTMLRRWLAGVR